MNLVIELIKNDWDKLLSVIFSVIAIVISVLSWRKSRVICGIETMVLRQPTGLKGDMNINTDIINKKLSSSKYTVLSILERASDKSWEIVLGKVKE